MGFFEIFCFVFTFGLGVGQGNWMEGTFALPWMKGGSRHSGGNLYLFLKQARLDLMSSHSVRHFYQIFNLNIVLIT